MKKLLFLIPFLLLLFSISLSAQSSKSSSFTTTVKTSDSGAVFENNFLNTKSLFEQANNLNLTTDEFRTYINPTEANKSLWETVITRFENDESVDINLARGFLKGIKNGINNPAKLKSGL